MHVVVERMRPEQTNLVEISCAPAYTYLIQAAIRNVTGSRVLPIELTGDEVVFVTDALTLEEGTALLELIVDQRRAPSSLSRAVIAEHLETQRLLRQLRERLQIDALPDGIGAGDYADLEAGL